MIEARQRVARPLSPELRLSFARLVEERVGIRPSEQQLRGLDETIAAVLAGAGCALTPEDLRTAFARGERADLFDALAARLTIGESHFFRIAPQIAALREVVLPQLLARRAAERRLTLWSAGCSTGEEPYTLAILLREALPDPARWEVALLATDLSEPALDAARRASYRDWSFRETPARIRNDYFDRAGDSWQLHESVRRMVRFARHNLVADTVPPPGQATGTLDLILCRNVTIYFDVAVAQHLYARFADALAPGGWLILGPSDAPPQGDRFAPVYLPGAVLWRAVAPATTAPPAAPRAAAPAPTPRRLARVAAPPREERAVRCSTYRLGVPAPPPASPPVAPGEAMEEQLARIGALAAAGEHEAARAQLAQLTRDAPLAVGAHRLLGLLALDAQQPAAALESLRRATFLDADDPLAQFGLGRAYAALGDAARARAAFRQARRILAAWPGDRPIPGDAGLAADELRGLVEAQLAADGQASGGAQ